MHIWGIRLPWRGREREREQERERNTARPTSGLRSPASPPRARRQRATSSSSTRDAHLFDDGHAVFVAGVELAVWGARGLVGFLWDGQHSHRRGGGALTVERVHRRLANRRLKSMVQGALSWGRVGRGRSEETGTVFIGVRVLTRKGS